MIHNTHCIHLVILHFQELRRALLSTLGSSTGVGSVALNGGGANSPARSRAVAEAVLVWRVMLRLREELRRVGMWSSFQGEFRTGGVSRHTKRPKPEAEYF